MVLDKDQLSYLLGQAPPSLDEEVKAVIDRTYRTLEQHYGKVFRRPVVVYDLEGTTAGQATWHEDGRHLIRINLQLLRDNKHDMLTRTVPHEHP